MSYDEKCEELARHFLATGASKTLIAQLAQEIQTAAEDGSVCGDCDQQAIGVRGRSQYCATHLEAENVG